MKFIALASALAADFVIGAASGSNVRSPHSRALRAVTHLNICPRTGLDLFYRIWPNPELRLALVVAPNTVQFEEQAASLSAVDY